MKKILLAFLLLALPLRADVPGVQTLAPQPNQSTTVGDPCLATGSVKQSAAISVAAAGTTQLVAVSATQVIYVCGFVVTTTGVTTVTTAQFEYGTGAACTGPTVLTGTFAQSLVTSAIVVVATTATQFSVPVGNGLCIVVAGTTPSVQGYLTYVQR